MGDPIPSSPKPKSAFDEQPPILSGALPAPAQEVPKKEKPMTVGGFAENALDDAWDFAKGLYSIIPSTIKSYQQNVPYLLRNAGDIKPGMLFNWNEKEGEFKGAIPETAKGILEAVKQPYKEHGARVVYEKPFTVAADAITLLTVGGTQLKNIGRIAEASGAGEKAARLIKAGEYLEQLPSKLARGAVDKGVELATGHDLAKERQFLHIKQEERGAEMLKLQDVAKDSLPKIDALNPEEQAIFHKARVGGGTAYGVSEEVLNANPRVKAALEAYAPLEQYSKETALKWHRLAPEEMDAAMAKKFALENFGDVSKANVAKAAELIEEARQTGKRLPMYGPNVFEGKGPKAFTMDDVLQDMMTGGKNLREGKVGAYEELKGALGYTKDPRVYTRQMVKAAADVEAKSRMMDRLLQEKELITAKGGKAAEGFKPGESIPEGVHRKYYEDPIRAQALQTITDPTIKRLLTWEYTGKQNAMLRLYDKFNSIFTKMATRYNPKWVPGNIVGDAFLGALFGADWDAARAAIKARQLPAQFLSGKVSYVAEDALKKKGIIEGALDRYGDIAGQIDAATRAGILHKSVADKLKNFAANHEAFAQSIEEVLTSTQRFSDVQVGLQRIEEDVARRSVTVRARDKEIAILQQREQVLAAKLEGRELQKTITNQERLGTLQGKAEAKAQRAAELGKPPGEHDWMHQAGPSPSEAKIAKAKESAGLAEAKAEAMRQKAVLGRTGEPGFEKGLRVLDTIRQKIVNKTAERNAIVRDIMDDLIKQGELDKLVPGLREQVNIVREGVDRANAVLPSYLALNGLEQRIMGRIIPFYPFVKTMTMLAFRIPFLAPIKSFMWNRLSDFLMTMTNDPRLPENFSGKIPFAVTNDGKLWWVDANTYNPFNQLKTSNPAGIPVPGMLNVGERNPILSLGFRFLGGKTVFDAGTIPYGTEAVLTGDGTRIRFKENGKLIKEANPTPLVAGIMHMFPSVQLAQSVLTPFWTNKYDWAGMPEPILNPDGSYKYPKELQDRLANLLGINLQTRNKEDVIRQERLKAQQAMKDYMKMYKKADPDEKELIRDALQDYQRGLYRHFDR